MNKQTLITSIFLLVIIGLLTVIVVGSKSKTQETTTVQNNQNISETTVVGDKIPIFFYGSTCPHCADVEKWMNENKVEEKITIVKKEVYDNRQNSQELTEAAKNCSLPTDSIGVPFLYTEGKCLIGTPDIIKYLSEKAGVINASGSAERSNS